MFQNLPLSRWHSPPRATLGHQSALHFSAPSDSVVGKALLDRIDSSKTTAELNSDDAFFVADLGEVYRQHEVWTSNLRRIKPYDAIKCNPDSGLIKFLASLGTGFDCASKREIQQVLEAGVEPSRILYANPCKSESCLRFAAEVKRLHPESELLLRISTDDSTALCPLSMKYGASLDSTKELLELAQALDLKVIGVSFHVGSGTLDPTSFYGAVRDARVVFDQANELVLHFTTLDVGGGFSSSLFLEMATVLNRALDKFFQNGDLKIIAEPGRFFVETAFTLACQVIGCSAVKEKNTRQQMCKLFLNDGVYGNFSGIIFDHQHPRPQVLKNGNNILYGQNNIPSAGNAEAEHPLRYSIWGHSCDGPDMIAQSWLFPVALYAGDWLYFENMGACTRCSATRFNGFKDDHDIVYVNSQP